MDDYEFGYLWWRGSDHEGSSFFFGMENHDIDPANVTRWKHKFGLQNRGVQWDTTMSKWAGEGKDWMQLVAQGPPQPAENDEAADGEEKTERERRHQKETKRPRVLGAREARKGQEIGAENLE